MTRQHFEMIAATLRAARHDPVNDSDTVDHIARELATKFAVVNPRFKRPAFLKACGCTHVL